MIHHKTKHRIWSPNAALILGEVGFWNTGEKMKEKFYFKSGGPELLDKIRPLWEKLKEDHANKSRYFSEEIANRQFEERKKELIEKGISLRIDLVFDKENGALIGYCASTVIDGDKGEIDSLYVLEAYRETGTGKRLTKSALAWLESQKVTEIFLNVLDGNEEVISFYNKLGFYPRNIRLVHKKK